MKRKFLLLFLLFFCTACSKNEVYRSGNYEGTGEGRNGLLRLNVTINDKGKIDRINILESHETKDIMNNVHQQLSKEMIRRQSADVDTVSGATQSSRAYIQAVKEALRQAK